MLGLDLAEQGAWWRLVSFTHECQADGYLVRQCQEETCS
ncbi:hypothetical protein ES705_32656 [subsurface metagenome]